MTLDLAADEVKALRDGYLRLVEDAVLGKFAPDSRFVPVERLRSAAGRIIARALARRGFTLGTVQYDDPREVETGKAWPTHAISMIGRDRLANVRTCLEDILSRQVPGDLIETGVWRGGAAIYMRAILNAWGITDRRVCLADSFEGLPPPDLEHFPADK